MVDYIPVREFSKLTAYENLSYIYSMFTSLSLKLLISRTLGYFCFFLSLSQKTPQIATLYNKKTTQGLNKNSIYFDFLSGIIEVMYCWHNKLSFHTWVGSLKSCLLELIILILFWHYSNNKMCKSLLNSEQIFFFGSLILFILICLTDGGILFLKLPEIYWWSLIKLKIPLNGFSKISTIYKILKSEKVEGVSETRYIMGFFKHSLKIIIVYLDSKNNSILFNEFFNAILNLSVYLVVKNKKWKKL
jgi:hypothetical protein